MEKNIGINNVWQEMLGIHIVEKGGSKQISRNYTDNFERVENVIRLKLTTFKENLNHFAHNRQ